MKLHHSLNKTSFTLAAASLVLTNCASMEKSILLGTSVGAGTGALMGNMAGQNKGMWIGTAVGAAAGGIIGYLGHKGKERSKMMPKGAAASEERASLPQLNRPEVRALWVPDKIDGNKFEAGHFIYVIDKQSTWSR